MKKYQTKRVLSNRIQDAVTKSGKSGIKSSNRFHSLAYPDSDDYEECFPPLSGSSSKTQKLLSSQDQLFIDAAKSLVPSMDLARRVSLEEQVDCLFGLSPIQIAEGLKLTFRPLSRTVGPFVLGQRSVVLDEVKEKQRSDVRDEAKEKTNSGLSG
ncbi:hypothetical protein U1Q18_037874 [Sarracenia purpurea var. burkii]